MGGLARICKAYGAMVIQGVRYVWDYAKDEAVPEKDMPLGSELWLESERARFAPHVGIPATQRSEGEE